MKKVEHGIVVTKGMCVRNYGYVGQNIYNFGYIMNNFGGA